MSLKSPVAVAALVLSLTAAADANAASATCRDVHTGAVDRVCRWQVGKGDFVDVYYGTPSPSPPAEPPRSETDHAPPPVYYAEPAYYDYGYVWPFGLGAHAGHVRDRHRGPRPLVFGPHPDSHGVFQAGLQSSGFHGHGGGRRR